MMKKLAAWWNQFTTDHPLVDRLARNSTAWGIFVIILYFAFNKTLLQTDLRFVSVMVLVFITANIGLWVYSKVSHSDTKEDAIVRAALVAAIMLGTAYVAGQFFQQEHQSSSIENLNEEIQQADSLKALK